MKEDIIKNIEMLRKTELREHAKAHQAQVAELTAQYRTEKQTIIDKYGRMIHDTNNAFAKAEAKPLREERCRRGFYAMLRHFALDRPDDTLRFTVDGTNKIAEIKFYDILSSDEKDNN